ncbi:MAG: CpsD/CapB family tyrosine-protein kinase, partial [Phormidesmis sp.]
AIAQTSQRVLLIDADLIRPTQHHIWDLPNLYGLSNLLVEQVELPEVMLSGVPNLTLLLGGARPPNPVSLLESNKMTALLEEFRAQFDYVILDAPSLSCGASTSILGKMADGLLLVVRPRVADRNSVNYSKELLSRSQQNVLGVVVNGALPKYEPHSYFLSKEFYEEAMTRPESADAEAASRSIETVLANAANLKKTDKTD